MNKELPIIKAYEEEKKDAIGSLFRKEMAFKRLNKKLRQDDDVIAVAMMMNLIISENIPDIKSLKQETKKKLIQQEPMSLASMSEDDRNDLMLCKTCAESSPLVYLFIGKDMKKSRELALYAVSQFPRSIENMSDEFRSDVEITSLATRISFPSAMNFIIFKNESHEIQLCLDELVRNVSSVADYIKDRVDNHTFIKDFYKSIAVRSLEDPMFCSHTLHEFEKSVIGLQPTITNNIIDQVISCTPQASLKNEKFEDLILNERIQNELLRRKLSLIKQKELTTQKRSKRKIFS